MKDSLKFLQDKPVLKRFPLPTWVLGHWCYDMMDTAHNYLRVKRKRMLKTSDDGWYHGKG